MSQAQQEFDPRNWQAQRRERLRRFEAAAIRPVPVVAVVPSVAPKPPQKAVWNVTPLRRNISMMHRLQIVVAAEFGIGRRDMISSSHRPVFAFPRQVAMYLTKAMLNKSLAETGIQFARRDHTTVLHACKKIERMIGEDPVFSARIEGIKAAVRGA